jgi:2-C-methyl-D-erythritol 2,4-cyclodiphosphate synthase
MVPLMVAYRIGHGYDLHRLRAGGQLVLGGVVVAQDLSPIAHSDGDVVMHALVDALLGAIGAGDIGLHFPDTDPKHRGAPSRLFLEHAVGMVSAAGYRVANADVTILAERPRLSPHRAAMSALLGQILNAPVNIKAGTNEGCDAVGRGEAIAAHAVVLLTACS